MVASVLLDLFPKSRGGLVAAHDLSALWAKACNLELSCDEFTVSTEEKYAYLNAKGADIKILLLWLVPGTFKAFRVGIFGYLQYRLFCIFRVWFASGSTDLDQAQAEIAPAAVHNWTDNKKALVLKMILALTLNPKPFILLHGLKLADFLLPPKLIIFDPRTLKALANLILLMEQYKYVLTGAAVPTAKRRVRRFLLGYLWLSFDAFCKSTSRYKLRPKQL